MAEAFNLALGPLPDAPPAAQLRFSAELVRMLRAAGDALLASGVGRVREDYSAADFIVLAPGLNTKLDQLLYAHPRAAAGGGGGGGGGGGSHAANSTGAQRGPASRPDSGALSVSDRWRDKLPRLLQRAAFLRLDKAEALKEMGSAAQPCFLAVLGVGQCASSRAPAGTPAAGWKACPSAGVGAERVHPTAACCGAVAALITAAED
jgi:hypothetical protein